MKQTYILEFYLDNEREPNNNEVIVAKVTKKNIQFKSFSGAVATDIYDLLNGKDSWKGENQ